MRVRASNLLISPLLEYQYFLHKQILELHSGGMGYRRIAHWLNENGYKTPRGKKFYNNHVFSRLKKRRVREEPKVFHFADLYPLSSN